MEKREIEELYFATRKKLNLSENTHDITLSEIRNLLHELIFVDIREVEEQNVSMIPGAKSKSKFEEELNAGKIIPEKSIIIPYCTIGIRSAIYTETLRNKFPSADIRNFRGSILSWTYLPDGENMLIDKNNNPTKKVHVFGPTWSLAHNSFSPVYFGTVQRYWVSFTQWIGMK